MTDKQREIMSLDVGMHWPWQTLTIQPSNITHAGAPWAPARTLCGLIVGWKAINDPGVIKKRPVNCPACQCERAAALLIQRSEIDVL